MNKFLVGLFFFIITVPVVFDGGIPAVKLVYGQQPSLQQSLQEKGEQLQVIHSKLQETQQQLSETSARSQTLNGELKKLSREIKQINLGIEVSQVTIEKLTLEKQSLEDDIDKLRQKINSQKKAIIDVMHKIQQKDQETALFTLLRNETLSASIAEAQGFSSLNASLRDNVVQLEVFNSELTSKLDQTTAKKDAVESEHRTLKARQSIALDTESGRKELLTQTKNQERLYQQQVSELEQQQIAIAQEIEQLEATLRAQTDPTTLPAPRPGVLGWPAQGRLSQEWGATRFAKYGYHGKWHNGIDIAAPIGTIIVAAGEGIVLAVGNQDRYCPRGAYGKYIVIKHLNNLVTLYAHLSGQVVEVGQHVNRGDSIGFMGRTGYATGSHLHLTVYDAKTFAMRPSGSCGLMPSGGDLNPLNYL